MNTEVIKNISLALYKNISDREAHKEASRISGVELRRIAVEDCGFDQEMVMKSNIVDLLDGYLKGFRAALIATADHGGHCQRASACTGECTKGGAA